MVTIMNNDQDNSQQLRPAIFLQLKKAAGFHSSNIGNNYFAP